jgi:hypothetical protein
MVAVASFTAPQCGQGARSMGPPQALQNFASGGLACWQKEHFAASITRNLQAGFERKIAAYCTLCGNAVARPGPHEKVFGHALDVV